MDGLCCAFLLLVVFRPNDPVLRRATAIVLVVVALIGVLGAGLHLEADLRAPSSLWSALVHRAPVLAPLLYANLALLAALGLWGQHRATRG